MRSQLIPLALCGASIATAQRSCNGSPSLCGRLYSNVTFVGAHDSAFVGVLLTDNQYEPLADQMGKGIRFLQAQTHNSSGTIEMCHTTCLERDAGSLASYLAPVKTFLAANPNEVITLLLTNGDAIPVSQFRDAFVAAGLDGYAFAPGSQLAIDQWPTLGSLIDQGKRLVVFMGLLPSSPLGRGSAAAAADAAFSLSQITTPTRRKCPTFSTNLTTSLRRRSTRPSRISTSAISTGRQALARADDCTW